MIDIQSLRALYPSPQAYTHRAAGGYCVGGALAKALGYEYYSFPDITELTDLLSQANPGLNAGEARIYALRITDANDRSQFEEAWALLGKALKGEAYETK